MKILLSGSNRGKRIEWIEKFGRLLVDEGFIPIFCKGRKSHCGILELMLALKLIFLTRLTLTFLITLRLFPRFSEIFPYIN